jgi:hypothetical protein
MSLHKPRRIRWAKSNNTIMIAMQRAIKPDPSDIAPVHAAMQSAFKALREGVATEAQWSILAGSLDVSMAIERQGAVRGLQGHLDSAHEALNTIATRARLSTGWQPTALHYFELDAIQTFMDLYAFQLSQLGTGEFLAAIESAKGKLHSLGHSVRVARSAEMLEAA